MQNGAHEAESPIKKVPKRSRQILDSDEDEDEGPVVKEPTPVQEKEKSEVPVVKEPTPVREKEQADNDASGKTGKVRGELQL